MQIKKGGSRMSDKKDFVYATPAEKDDFIDSLDSLKLDDVVPPHRKRAFKPEFSAFKAGRIFLILLCIGIFVYCVSELFVIVSDYGKGEDLYEDIRDDYMSLLNSFTASGVTNMTLSKSDMPMSSYHDVFNLVLLIAYNGIIPIKSLPRILFHLVHNFYLFMTIFCLNSENTVVFYATQAAVRIIVICTLFSVHQRKLTSQDGIGIKIMPHILHFQYSDIPVIIFGDIGSFLLASSHQQKYAGKNVVLYFKHFFHNQKI